MTDHEGSRSDELTGPYFDDIRAQLNHHWNELIHRYEEKYGVTVPLLTRQQVREAALRNKLPAGTDWWLAVALGVASSLRPDLEPEELQRLFAVVRRGDASLQLNPQPIAILTAIAAVSRPAPSTTRVDPPLGPTRTGKPGRPQWNAPLFDAHLREATERADFPKTDENVAAEFEVIDGTVGTSPEYLRTLRRHRRRGEMAE